MRTSIYPTDPEACDAALPPGGAERRRAAGRHQALSTEELALIASCGERIRKTDRNAIRRAEQAAPLHRAGENS